MLAAVLGWWLWVDYHNRQIRKEWRDHPIEVDQDFAAQAELNRRLDELAQRIREKACGFGSDYLSLGVAKICQQLAEPLMLKTALTLIALFTLGFCATGRAQQQENINVRLARIEELIKATNQRIDQRSDAIEKRLDDLNISLNQRIDDTNKRIDDTNQRLDNDFTLLTAMLAALIGLNTVMLGVAFWIARQDRPVSKKHYDKLLKQDKDMVDQFNALEGEQLNQRRRQDELAGVVQRSQTDGAHRVEELTQKLRDLQAELAALQPPAA